MEAIGECGLRDHGNRTAAIARAAGFAIRCGGTRKSETPVRIPTAANRAKFNSLQATGIRPQGMWPRGEGCDQSKTSLFLNGPKETNRPVFCYICRKPKVCIFYYFV